MKKIKLLILFLSLTCAVISSCKKSDNPLDPNNPPGGTATNNIVINGGGYTNASIGNIFENVSFDSNGVTTVGIGGRINQDTTYVLAQFTGITTGTYQFNNSNILLVGLRYSGGTFQSVYTSGTQGSIVVTKYERTSGGKVEGRFNATLLNRNNPNDSITVNATSFSATRR